MICETAEIPDLEERIKDVKTLAAKLYKKYAVKGMELEDLVSEGIVGLYDAHRRFDEKRGVSFKTYSHYRIKGSMLDSIRRWLPCNHQTDREERLELISKFERHAAMEGYKKQQIDLEESVGSVVDSDLSGKLLSCLTESGKMVIKGVIQESKKLGEVAEELNISKSKVVSIRDAAIKTMKEEAEKLGIEHETFFSNRNG